MPQQYKTSSNTQQHNISLQKVTVITNIQHEVFLIKFDEAHYYTNHTKQLIYELGAQYGGFLTSCQQDYGDNDTNALKSCVQKKCDTVFDKLGMEDLKSGCDWYVDWFEMADNPNLKYEVVA